MKSVAVQVFLDEQHLIDGYPPLSEAKEFALGDPKQTMVIMEGDEVVALGVIQFHETPNGGRHAAFETVVPRSMRFNEFEDRVVAETVAMIPRDVPYTAWSRRGSLDTALERRGMTLVRSLAEMSVPLPIVCDLPDGDPLALRPFADGDVETLLTINRAAFGDHPEAGTLDEEELAELMQEPWFDPNGVLLYDANGDVGGFCWTKVHPNGEGEIYRIGVDPRHRGRGLGRRLTLAGFDHLTTARGCTTGFLWVDEANTPAVTMYQSIGLATRTRNREFAPPSIHP